MKRMAPTVGRRSGVEVGGTDVMIGVRVDVGVGGNQMGEIVGVAVSVGELLGWVKPASPGDRQPVRLSSKNKIKMDCACLESFTFLYFQIAITCSRSGPTETRRTGIPVRASIHFT